MRAEPTSPVSEIGTLIHTEAVDGEWPTNTIADITVNGSPAKDTVGVDPVMRDVPRISEKCRVLTNRQAVWLDVVSEI